MVRDNIVLDLIEQIELDVQQTINNLTCSISSMI